MRTLRSIPRVLAATLLASGCYKSDYVPPVDGRARIIWHQTSIALEPLNQIVMTPRCLEAVRNTVYRLRPHGRRLRKGELPAKQKLVYSISCPSGRCTPDGFWTPQLVWSRGRAQYVLSPLLATDPDLGANKPNTKTSSEVVPTTEATVFGLRLLPETMLWGVAGTLSVLFSPLILPLVADLRLFDLEPPELGALDPNAAVVMDFLNIYNDLARSTGTPCSYTAGKDIP